MIRVFNKKGETLLEVIASLMVFAILASAVTHMVFMSIRITQNVAVSTAEMQEFYNEAVMADPSADVAELRLDFGDEELTIAVGGDDYTLKSDGVEVAIEVNPVQVDGEDAGFRPANPYNPPVFVFTGP